ncbi:hypothetical protein ACEPPN_005583 [Leptodophora sp. 'Broadleaf-Isolate-01']
MSLDMDFFDWPQLAEHFGEDNLPAGLENISAPENNDVASLTWTDYFTPPNAKVKANDSNLSTKLQNSLNEADRPSAVPRTPVNVKKEAKGLRMM